MKKVPYIIEKNPNGTFAIIENPKSEIYGTAGWAGDMVVRSPFNTREEAVTREKEIGEAYEFEPVEVKE